MQFVIPSTDHMRFRRSPQEDTLLRRVGPPGPPPAPLLYPADDSITAGSAGYAKPHRGKVGPVYTFVKTDPKANFKWGVRHVAGVQYGK